MKHQNKSEEQHRTNANQLSSKQKITARLTEAIWKVCATDPGSTLPNDRDETCDAIAELRTAWNEEKICLKGETIDLLKRVRMTYRTQQNYKGHTEGELRGMRVMAIHICSFAELCFQNDMWTSLPDEKDLTEHSSMGDHVAVTRKTVGLTP